MAFSGSSSILVGRLTSGYEKASVSYREKHARLSKDIQSIRYTPHFLLQTDSRNRAAPSGSSMDGFPTLGHLIQSRLADRSYLGLTPLAHDLIRPAITYSRRLANARPLLHFARSQMYLIQGRSILATIHP